MEEIKDLYLKLVEAIKKDYEEGMEVKVKSYDKDFLVEHHLSDVIDSIYTYLDENSEEE